MPPNLELILTMKTTIMMTKAKYIVVYEDNFKRELKKLSDKYQNKNNMEGTPPLRGEPYPTL